MGACASQSGSLQPDVAARGCVSPSRQRIFSKPDMLTLSQCPVTAAGGGEINIKIGFGGKEEKKGPSLLHRRGSHSEDRWRG